MKVDEKTSLLQKSEEAKKKMNFKMEPALLLVLFGWNLAVPLVPNQLLKQTCLTFGFNSSDCSHLGVKNETKKIEEAIQPLVAQIIMTISLLDSIIPGLLSLFYGPWSDKFGRKKVICATFIGHFLALAALVVISFLYDRRFIANPWLYVIPYVPLIITGGWPTMIVATLCYVTDLSDESSRSTRLAIMEMITFIGILLGIASCSFVFKLTCANTVFIVSTALVGFASIYSLIFIEESLKTSQSLGVFGQITELLSPKSVIKMLKTCFKKRQLNERKIIWFLIVTLTLVVSTSHSTKNVFYLFAQKKFNWNLKEITMFDSSSLLISIVGCTSGLAIFKRLLKFPDISIAVIALISLLAESIILATAQTTTEMYFAAGVCLFKILAVPMCRSMIASIIPKTEIGKIYSFSSALESVSSLITAPLFTFIYAKTFTYFAGAFFFVTSFFSIFSLILVLCVNQMKKDREKLLNSYAQIAA